MPELLNITLAGLPPSVNTMYRTYGRRRYKTRAAKDYQQTTAAIMRMAWGRKPPELGDVGLEVLLETTSRRRWDIDNRLKALIDCIEDAGIVLDDRQVCSIHISRQIADSDRTTVTLWRREQEGGK